MSEATPHIGTLRERPLHASLKRWYARPGDRVETPVAGFVIDLVREDVLIEVQTSGFSSMKRKLASLLELGHRVRIVHSIPIDKWIVKVDADGTVLSRRRSPKHGRPTDIFAELVSLPEVFVHPHLEVDLLLTIEEEHWRHTPGVGWRRKGWTVIERRLIEVVGSLQLNNADDLTRLIPDGLPETFTTADLAAKLGRPRGAAQQMAYCLRRAGVCVAVGKRGNSVEYRVG
ncbi:MAG TPA: hypothetical protein VJQ79_00685 [Acidimicrobiia bacterium]|nr:hypothetical protein [Acidimicrobiia bacterium]